MNAYLVRILEMRAETPYPLATDPPEPWWPTGIFAAATPAQAKRDALRVWSSQSRSGVYGDDWTSLRVRLLERDVDFLGGPVPRGEIAGRSPHFTRLWYRVHEVLDHGGAPCDCALAESA